ncbi:hypothetical protein BGX33_003313, partial [Mortierella sp. NVP41]
VALQRSPSPNHVPLPAVLLPWESNTSTGTNTNTITNTGASTCDDDEKNYYNTWNLCHPCRLKYRRSSDANDPFTNPSGYRSLPRLLSSRLARSRYFLTPAHSRKINSRSWINSDERNGEDIYLHSEVKVLTLEVHSGWAGIEALQRGPAKKSIEQFEKCKLALVHA